jgi:2-keto-4-pentenoate hydratase/2-oxohepta-3-ene-1,7-dioic acid hydratase in catechol pathway
MKFMSFRHSDGSSGWGVVQGDDVVDLSGLATDLKSFLTAGGTVSDNVLSAGHSRYPLKTVKFLPPIINPDKIICIGLNYLSHVLEGGRPPPTKPTIFTRFANTQIGHLQPMLRPKVSDHLDFEGELAVVIGKSCRYVKPTEAGQVIAGYSCYNDGSVRDWQRHASQFTPGKNFVGTGGFGPWLVTPDEFGDPAKASLVTRLNGEEMQRATIDDLVFDIPNLIEYCSTFTSLEPGDVIITGTTGGVGAYREPPVWMKPGDVVEVEISGIGILRNPISQAS